MRMYSHTVVKSKLGTNRLATKRKLILPVGLNIERRFFLSRRVSQYSKSEQQNDGCWVLIIIPAQHCTQNDIDKYIIINSK